MTFPLYRCQFIERAMEAVRSALAEDEYHQANEEGRAMELKQALAYASQVVKEISAELHPGDVIYGNLKKL